MRQLRHPNYQKFDCFDVHDVVLLAKQITAYIEACNIGEVSAYQEDSVAQANVQGLTEVVHLEFSIEVFGDIEIAQLRQFQNHLELSSPLLRG